MTALPSSLPAASSPGTIDRRPGAAPTRAADGATAFAQTLAQVRARQPGRPAMSEAEVRPGDTLAGIVARHLQAAQPHLAPSRAQLFQLAASVARDNGIANPNRIQPGQVIDLTALESRAVALALPAGQRMPAELNHETSTAPPAPLPAPRPSRGPLTAASQFLVRHAQAAHRTEEVSGIPAHFMLAQAALETGWGQREIRSPEGRNSHNLFGIRAGPMWQGPTVDVWTTEYIEGVPQRMVGRFRAYASYEESFADYARLISSQPRYAEVMRSTGDAAAFSSALQRAGYATGPRYASALKSVIDTTVQLRASVPEVQMAMSSGAAPQWTAQAAASEPALVPAAQALNLRWTPIAPMPGSAVAQVASAIRSTRVPS